MTGRSRPPGHRLLPHTADCIIEAWASDRVSCLAEAMRALVAVFAEVPDGVSSRSLPIAAEAASDRDLLVSLLEEVIYATDVLAVVPVRFHLSATGEGAVTGDMEVVEASRAELVGPVPKGVSYHGLEINQDAGEWRCRTVIDV